MQLNQFVASANGFNPNNPTAVTSANAVGNVYLNARWQFNANGMYQAKYGIEIAGNVFPRQGYPFPLFRSQTLGADSGLPVLVTPEIDTFRHPNVWDTDMRVHEINGLLGSRVCDWRNEAGDRMSKDS